MTTSPVIDLLTLGAAAFAAISGAVGVGIATIISMKQHNLEKRNWVDEHFHAVRLWAKDVTSAIAIGIHYCDDFEHTPSQRMEILARLSASIDTGRWYFPNIDEDGFGNHKLPAYRGVRQKTLDPIVDAYKIISSEHCTRSSKKSLVGCQRTFVSSIQDTLNPKRRDVEIKETLNSF